MTAGPKRKKIVWSQEMNAAYEQLKDRLIEDVTLAFPDYSKHASKLEVFVDASSKGAGACLVQKQGNQYRTIAYASTTFSDTETRYSTIDRELLAIRWGVKIFRSFLFGVPFILYTDHKPLIYLHNMSRENSKLMRTINDLADYTFEIRYRPGRDNAAADAMSRIMDTPTVDEYDALVNSKELPKGLFVPKLVEGGGDSMMEALLIVIEEIRDELEREGPTDKSELRKEMVDYLVENSKLFKIKLNKENKKQFKVMREDGQLPCQEILLAACKVFNVEIWVHYGISSPTIFKVNSNSNQPVIHLQCLAGIHFNPVVAKSNKSLNLLIKEKNINLLYHNEEIDPSNHQEMEDEIECDDIKVLYTYHKLVKECNHSLLPSVGCILSVGHTKFCTLIDTGAQVSLLAECVWDELKKTDESLNELSMDSNIKLNSVGDSKTPVLRIVNLKPDILNIETKKKVPFAIVKDEHMPCCSILGANFLVANNIALNFEKGELYMENDGEVVVCPLEPSNSVEDKASCRINMKEYFGSIGLTSDDDTDVESSKFKVKVSLPHSTLIMLQSKDYAIRSLIRNIKENIPTAQWKNCLNQFKRSSKCLRICNDLLVRVDVNKEQGIPVVSFPLLIEIMHKVHEQVAHIGKHKLIDIVSNQFYHPAIIKMANDICTSCAHCQLYKIGKQTVTPPTLKIKADYPYDLVAMDLLQFSKSSENNVAVLVAIDHYSKFLFAVPLKNKRAETVANALYNNILPKMLSLPTRILTDNGPEFKSIEFNSRLQEFNIDHIYSTRYKASSNGAVERSNRTITEILKGIINNNPANWDRELGKAVILYNNTLHSELGATPSQYILQNAFTDNSKLPIKTDTIASWKEGHPQFKPFRLNQKVVQKIQRIGNKLSYKLGKKYEGPFEIVKVQSNGVTYEIKDLEGEDRVLKAHHRQLKAWIEPPRYLRKYLEVARIENKTVEKEDRLSEAESIFYGVINSSSSSGSESFSRFDDSKSESSSTQESNSLKSSLESDNDTDEDSQMSEAKTGSEESRLKSDESNEQDNHNTSRILATRCIVNRSNKNRVKSSKQVTFAERNRESVPLSELQCSESVNYERLGEVNNRQVSKAEIENKNKSLELEKSNNDKSLEHNDRRKNKISTPQRADSNTYPEWEVSRIKDQSSPVGDSQRCKEISREKEETVLDLINNTLTLQEGMIEEIINSQEAREKVDEAQELEGGETQVKSREVVGFTPTNEETFHGFGEDTSNKCKTSARIQALRTMKQQLEVVRHSVENFKAGNNNFIRQIWRNHYMCSESRLEIGSSGTNSEMSSRLGVSRALTYSNPTGVVTRSQGPVQGYPNVQAKTLEYKNYSKRNQLQEGVMMQL